MRHLEEEKEEVTGFNKKVTYRDPLSGQIVKKDPYIKRVCRSEGGGNTRYYERPIGSGNLWDAQGNAVGRWDHTKPEGQRFIKDVEHKPYVPTMTEDEKLANKILATENKNKALLAELESVKAELAKKAEVKSKSKES